VGGSFKSSYFSILFAPSRQNLLNLFMSLKSTIQTLGFTFQIVLLSLSIRVSKRLDLSFTEGDELALFFFRQVSVSFHFSFDVVLDQRKDGIVVVFHVSLGQTFESRVQHGSLDITSFLTSQSSIEFSVSTFDDTGKDLVSIHFFHGFSLSQDVLGSVVDVLLEVLVFVGHEVVDGFSLNSQKFSVHFPEFELMLGHHDHFSHLKFDVFMIENFEVIAFVGSDSSVESGQKGLEQRFSPFQEEVHKLEPEDPREEGGFGDPVEIEGADTETQEEETSPEDHSILSGHEEVFVMGRDLFGSNEVVEKFSGLDGREVQRMVFRVVRVGVALGERSLGGRLEVTFGLFNSFSEAGNMFLISNSASIEEFLGSGERSTSDRSHDRLYLSLDLGLLTKKSMADPDLLKHP